MSLTPDGKLMDNPESKESDTRRLRGMLIASLEAQGFVLDGSRLRPPPLTHKEDYRVLHEAAVQHKKECSRSSMERLEPELLGHIANGWEVDPWKISPRIDVVSRGSIDELIFRYIKLHWSIPVSAGYGRRLRFIVRDQNNNKIIGIIGLCDPVYSLAPRDEWIGWSPDVKKEKLYHVLDAFVLGAVPPYSTLICGKLIAMLTISNEVKKAFSNRYRNSISKISGLKRPASLALVTTTSALGRSSLYARLKNKQHYYMIPVGYTKGSGDFHFMNGLYEPIRDFVINNCTPSAKNPKWGTGFRNRREVIKFCLKELNLPTELVYHGINRQVFVAPTGYNSKEFLTGDHKVMRYYNYDGEKISHFFRERWLIPRALRDHRYQQFINTEYSLWPPK